jgi:hypothetical protein
VFKQRTTQVILAEIKLGVTSTVFAPDPLDDDLLRLEGATHGILRL